MRDYSYTKLYKFRKGLFRPKAGSSSEPEKKIDLVRLSLSVCLSVPDAESTHLVGSRKLSKTSKNLGNFETFCANFFKTHSQDFNFGCLSQDAKTKRF